MGLLQRGLRRKMRDLGQYETRGGMVKYKEWCDKFARHGNKELEVAKRILEDVGL